MQSPKNWKNPIKNFLCFLVFLIAGCTTSNISMRPSFDKDYENDLGKKSSAVRVSRREKTTDDDTQTEIMQEDSDNEFDIQPRKYKEIPDATSSLYSLESIRAAAEKYLGTPYHYGGTTKHGFDCSGFIWRVFQDAGYKNFSRTTAESMFNSATPVLQNSLREGDLCFFYDPKNRKKINHAGIYIGQQRFIHSSNTNGVAYSNLSDHYWSNRFAGFRRVLP